MKAIILAAALLFIFPACLQAKLVKETVPYNVGEKVFKGYMVYDDQIEGKRPGVLVIHEWWGLNDYAKMRADQLAEMGYVAFAADMYGEGKATREAEEAAKLSGQLRGTPALRQRAQAALEVLKNNKLVDAKRLAAIGFCFGGTTVLELAYSGADIAGIVSFHGGLPIPEAGESGKIKAKIFVLIGSEDPSLSREARLRFREVMDMERLDWQMAVYGGAVHAFSNPAAGTDKSRGAAYDEKAAKRSWEAMKAFFREIFGETPAVKTP